MKAPTNKIVTKMDKKYQSEVQISIIEKLKYKANLNREEIRLLKKLGAKVKFIK